MISTPIALSQSMYTIRGRVVDQSGANASGALVGLYSLRRAFQSKVDWDGRFDFADVPGGRYELDVSLTGFKTKTIDFEITERAPEPISITLEIGPGGHCTITELPAGSVPLVEGRVTYEKRSSKIDLEGVVRDQFGSPLSAVTVNLVGEGVARTTVSDEKGEFSFTGLEPGKYTLKSSHKGYGDRPAIVWITRDNLTKAVVALVDMSKFCFE